MALDPFAATTLALEARALLTRVVRLQPFALVMPMVGAARVSDEAALAVEHYLRDGQRELRRRIRDFLRWLQTPAGRGSTAAEAQRRFSFLKLRFNAAITQFDIFADALSVRGEVGSGVWLGGLDVVAEDALSLEGTFFEMPPVITYLDRGHGAAIRRARTRLPGGGDNPVAVIRMPRERMIGSGIASSLVHEVGHQGAALLDLVASLRRELQVRQRWSRGLELVAWQLWERWISEIVADFWSAAKLGIAATQGLMNVVSLPRAFVFRIAPDDPHPFPWIRVKLSIGVGRFLYPDPQWALFDRLWESFYPTAELEPQRRQLVATLVETLPEFVRLLAGHRTRALGGLPLARAFDINGRRPELLRRIYRDTAGKVTALQSLAPTLALAVLGQAKQDRLLTPERESPLVAELLTRWGVNRVLGKSRTARTQPKALVA
jgi:hypothetical protein